MTDFPIVVLWSDEDGGWIADIPDLRFCSAFGESPARALAEVLIAKEAWLDVAREHGDPIPQPTRRPTLAVAS